MEKTIILLVLLPLMFACSGPVDADVLAEQPNILFILADDLGYSDLSCYGGEIQTPHIDAVA